MSEKPKQSVLVSLINPDAVSSAFKETSLNYSQGDVYFYWDKQWDLIAVANDDHSWWIVQDEKTGLLSLESWEWNDWAVEIIDDPRYSQWLPPKHMR